MQLGLSQSEASFTDATSMPVRELDRELVAGRRELLAAVQDEIRHGVKPDRAELRRLCGLVLNLATEHRRRYPPPPLGMVTGVRRRRAKRNEK